MDGVYLSRETHPRPFLARRAAVLRASTKGSNSATHRANSLCRPRGPERLAAALALATGPGRRSRCALGRRILGPAGEGGAAVGAIDATAAVVALVFPPALSAWLGLPQLVAGRHRRSERIHQKFPQRLEYFRGVAPAIGADDIGRCGGYAPAVEADLVATNWLAAHGTLMRRHAPARQVTLIRRRAPAASSSSPRRFPRETMPSPCPVSSLGREFGYASVGSRRG
jgi:hypothetical protein